MSGEGNHKKRSNKTRPIPLRMDLPEEFAALALPDEQTGEATFVLNSSEKAGDAWRDLRFGGILIGVAAWLVEPIIRWIRNHTVVVTVGATVATSGLAYSTIDTILDGNKQPARPQPTVTVFAAPPRPTLSTSPSPTLPTRTPTPTATTTPTEPQIIITEAPTSGPETTARPSPTRSRTPARSTTPRAQPSQTAPPAAEPTTDPTTTEPVTSLPDESPPTSVDAPDPQPSITTAQRDCFLGVDLDPILDICVLG